MKQIGNQWELEWCKKSKCEFWYLRPLSLFQLLYVTLSFGIMKKAKNGLCMAASAIGRVPMRTWRVVQNGFLVWNVYLVFSAHPKDGKAATPQVTQINMEKRMWQFWQQAIKRNLLPTNIFFKKGRKISCWKISTVFFSGTETVSGIPTNSTKRCVFFAEAWNSADLLMMKASLPFFVSEELIIAWKSLDCLEVFGSLLCWTCLFLNFSYLVRKSWPFSKFEFSEHNHSICQWRRLWRSGVTVNEIPFVLRWWWSRCHTFFGESPFGCFQK